MGFYSFALRNVKKILINPLKSFHDWKMKFFFIREEVIPIAMIFRPFDEIEKEDTPIPKKEAWYDNLMPTPNRVFGELMLVAVGMSDKWPERSKEVPQALYQSAFKTFAGTMGVRPLRDGEEFWHKQIKPRFIYIPAELFVNPPVATEGTHILNPRPCRVVTSAGEEIVYLSSEEFVASSDHDLRSWDVVFAGVLRDLGIDHEEKKTKKAPTKKTVVKKKVSVDAGATSKKTGGGRATTEIPKKGLLAIAEKPQSNAVAASKSVGSAGSRGPDSGATPSSVYEEEEEAEEEVEGEKLVARKRSREEAAATTPPCRRLLLASQ
ncbi:hypothetical protein Hanom_Chr10g00906781 [Helianthus anomalus]